METHNQPRSSHYQPRDTYYLGEGCNIHAYKGSTVHVYEGSFVCVHKGSTLARFDDTGELTEIISDER